MRQVAKPEALFQKQAHFTSKTGEENMCIVHRIVKDSKTGNTTAIRFELAPKKGITLSTSAILNDRSIVLEADSSTTITFVEKKLIKPVRRESFTDSLRRLENGRLTGATIKLRAPEEHQLSPQSHTIIVKKYGDDDNLGGRYLGSGCSFRNAGRKPRNKHHRDHTTAW